MKDRIVLLLQKWRIKQPHSVAKKSILLRGICRGVLVSSLFLGFVGPCYGFDFGAVLDDVGNAVKSGASTIEEGVKKVVPGEEKKDNNQNKESTSKQRTDAPSSSAAKKSIFQEDTVATSKARKPQSPTPASTQPSEIQKKEATKTTTSEVATTPSAKSVTTAKSGGGGTLFSKEPINPEAPPVPTTSFTAGDKIYGLLKAAKPWKDLLGSSDYLLMYFYIDGAQKAYKSVGLKRQELLARNYFVIDIAPDPAAMTNYQDRDIVFPEKDGLKFGPELFTKLLSELSPGKHSIRLEVKAYNEVYAAGEFTIAGDNYQFYSGLLVEIKNSSGKQQTMPKPGMTDLALQKEMIGLLKNGGWPDIRRIVIVDKDWWIDRVSGGDSPVQSRHIEATAAAKDPNGEYYFHHVTFHQPMLITGNWGKLALTDTGKRKPIPEENIDK